MNKLKEYDDRLSSLRISAFPSLSYEFVYITS